jgi:hypothetical protein
MPTPAAATRAVPTVAPRASAGTSTVRPVTSALIWFQVRPSAPPPTSLSLGKRSPRLRISSRLWCSPYAVPSRIALTTSARVVDMDSPSSTPRASESQIGERSPKK